MNIPQELPIIYSMPILIPGYFLKIQLSVKDNIHLLDHFLKNSKSANIVGVIPIMDSGKVDDVIGTVGFIQSLVKFDSVPEYFFIFVHGICRFKLDKTISEEPLKINKIIIIENFKNFLGDEKEINELCNEFKKTLNDVLTYGDSGIIHPMSRSRLKSSLNGFPVYQTVEYVLRHIRITSADAYDILRATNLNDLVKVLINFLKRETINNSDFVPIGLVPLPSSGLKQQFMDKRNMLPELKEILTVIQKSDLPTVINDLIMKEFEKLQAINSMHSDYPVLLNYLSYVVNLPWNKSTNEILDLDKVKNVLQLNHYGIDKVKKRIIQFIAVRKLNPERRGPILCFVGPPGVGKTTIAKAIANSLNRIYKRISLGGINCFSDIKGHRKTYVGAMPGLIIQAINQAQTKNPVILLDEIDKMYKGGNGDPAAALLEVLDPEQNSTFVDSYVNLPFDLSQVMFIATANYADYIPPTLCDRLEIIYLDGYTVDEKTKIAENYLIPKIRTDYKMNEMEIFIPNDTINSIIQKYTYETGVRGLQRKLEAIYQYIAVDVVENADKKKESYVITPEFLLEILGSEKYLMKNTLIEQCCNRVGVAIGLSWTPVGGVVQVIETAKMHSKNRLILTGLAGQTLKESVEIALNWIKLLAEKCGLIIHNTCVHVHLPEGGQRKDGPSAGITIVCALISLFWNIPLRPMIAMTGEVSLTGYVLPVGGVKDKILAAYNSDIKTVIIPEANFIEAIENLPENVKENLNIIPVKHVTEVLDIVVPGGLEYIQNPTANVIPISKI